MEVLLNRCGSYGIDEKLHRTQSHVCNHSSRHYRMEYELTTAKFTMTSSNGNIFRVTGHLCGEFTGLRWIPRTKASDAELWCFFDLRLDKRLSKQSWCWWFETLSRPLWHHCNVLACELARFGLAIYSGSTECDFFRLAIPFLRPFYQ